MIKLRRNRNASKCTEIEIRKASSTGTVLKDENVLI